LPNRQFFIERLQQALVHAKRYQRLLGLLSLDLDQFKRINDTLGHSAGNELLLSVSQRLSDAVRAPDTFAHEGKETIFGHDMASTVARLGGDEFSLLITELTHYHDAAKVARRMLEELRKPFRVAKQEVFVSVSVGLALYPLDGDDAETLIKNAGAAMHFAKDQGRDNYQFYSRAMNATALEKLSMEAQLRRALERDELLLHYQPKIRPATGEIVGLEALIRWEHPELGLVSPAQFIPLAEETGLIVPLGEWVLLNACRQNQDWQRLGYPPVHVAVNIASLHFRQGTLGQSVATALQKSGLHPSWLELEVTESMLMDSAETTLATLSTLKGMGVRLGHRRFRDWLFIAVLPQTLPPRYAQDRPIVREGSPARCGRLPPLQRRSSRWRTVSSSRLSQKALKLRSSSRFCSSMVATWCRDSYSANRWPRPPSMMCCLARS
jgi:diguanylate cyclase (GGDEF)-like protein